jgi:hypothetical protein
MPHLHVLLFTENGEGGMSPTNVDEYISARIPPLVDLDDMSGEAFQSRRLRMTVCNSLLHNCNEQCRGVDGSDKCPKHYPKLFSTSTQLSGES